MKLVKIDDTKVRELITYDSENYFIGSLFKDLAEEIARENGIGVKVAKIMLALNTMESYQWIEISVTRIIFYLNSRSADVVNISNESISRYENGLKTEETDLEDYLRWSTFRKEVIA